MKQRNLTFGYIVLLAGIALIFAGFFLFVPEEKRNNFFWLDLSTACLIFLVNSVTDFGLLSFCFDFNKQVGGLGIRLGFIRLYTILAFAVILIGWVASINFRYQLFFQLLGIFLLLTGYFLSRLSSIKAQSISTKQHDLRKGKEDILKAINLFEILFCRDNSKWIAEKKRIDFLKEDIRYLPPSNNQSAFELDIEIATAIRKAYDFATEKNEGGSELFSLLSNCEELLKLRKQTYSN